MHRHLRYDLRCLSRRSFRDLGEGWRRGIKGKRREIGADWVTKECSEEWSGLGTWCKDLGQLMAARLLDTDECQVDQKQTPLAHHLVFTSAFLFSLPQNSSFSSLSVSFYTPFSVSASQFASFFFRISLSLHSVPLPLSSALSFHFHCWDWQNHSLQHTHHAHLSQCASRIPCLLALGP